MPKRRLGPFGFCVEKGSAKPFVKASDTQKSWDAGTSVSVGYLATIEVAARRAVFCSSLGRLVGAEGLAPALLGACFERRFELTLRLLALGRGTDEERDGLSWGTLWLDGRARRWRGSLAGVDLVGDEERHGRGRGRRNGSDERWNRRARRCARPEGRCAEANGEEREERAVQNGRSLLRTQKMVIGLSRTPR